MLVNLKYVLDLAEKGGFCIPAFNVYNMESAMGVVKAAEETRAPIIMQVYPRLMKEEAGYYLSPVIIAAAKRASVPVCFHLDHGPSELETTRAIRYGATGIMLDGSTLPFEENIAATKRVVDTCAHLDIQVEGELGHIGTTNDDTMDEFTTPEDAKRFVEETGVACLAVAAGIRKMDFATDICYAFLDCCLEELSKPERVVAVDNFMKKPIQAVKDFCVSRIKLVGADGKG